jgi:hypothetical protein
VTRARLLLAGTAAAAAVVTAWWPLSAVADAPVASAWWQVLRQTTPVGALPAAPVPDDGSLPVQNGPAGVVAFSAVRYDVGDAASATLTLTFARPVAIAPSIDLCVATTHWTDGADQEWDLRPTYSCTQHVLGTVANGAVTWHAGAAFIRDGELDAVIVPDPADPTPYAVSFAKPSGSSLAASPGATSLPEPAAPPASGPQPAVAGTGTSAGAPSAVVVPGAGMEPGASVAAPVVAPSSAGPQTTAVLPPTTPAGAQRPVGSRTLGAALLAALSAAFLLSGLVTGRTREGRSLLVRTASGDEHPEATA